MKIFRSLVLDALALLVPFCGQAIAGEVQNPFVRVAELEIEPSQLEHYKAAAKEEIETSIRVEPGVLALYAVSERDNPARIRILEIYASVDAYTSHIETRHFKKYKTGTREMVKSLKLIDVDPLIFSVKSH